MLGRQKSHAGKALQIPLNLLMSRGLPNERNENGKFAMPRRRTAGGLFDEGHCGDVLDGANSGDDSAKPPAEAGLAIPSCK